eukprot:3363379-Rhodomonas_salina.1
MRVHYRYGDFRGVGQDEDGCTGVADSCAGTEIGVWCCQGVLGGYVSWSVIPPTSQWAGTVQCASRLAQCGMLLQHEMLPPCTRLLPCSLLPLSSMLSSLCPDATDYPLLTPPAFPLPPSPSPSILSLIHI